MLQHVSVLVQFVLTNESSWDRSHKLTSDAQPLDRTMAAHCELSKEAYCKI